MNSFKQGAIVCVIALTQLLLNPRATASDEDYSKANDAQFSEAELAQILAPIALYPDSLLTHIVIASTYPLEVVEAYRWREKNSNLEPSEAVQQAENKGWDPSIAALVAFPTVLARLNEDLQWTQNLGEAFLEDEGRVLDAIQALRQQAERANSLNNMQNMRVTKLNKYIVIEPAHKEIVYVPYYDTRVVYGNWHWHHFPPVYWDFRPHLSVHFPANISARFHWNTGINISFNYYFSAFKWHSRHLVVTNHHKTRQYRSFNRISSSRSVKRWQHEPTHRRGVAYRSSKLKRNFGIKQRVANNYHNNRGTALLHKIDKKREQDTRSMQRNFKAKLARNNKLTPHRNSANKSEKMEKQAKLSHRQVQSKGSESSKKALNHSTYNSHELKKNGQHKQSSRTVSKHRQVNNKHQTENGHPVAQRQKIRQPKQSDTLSRQKKER